MSTALIWHCLPFAALQPTQLYELLRLRQQVFVLEQTCLYEDCDGFDRDALHLFATDEGESFPGRVVACCRILAPGRKYREASIGRVCTAASHRRLGLGRELMLRALQQTVEHYPGHAVRISAQQYLQQFYTSLGFSSESQPYDEDGIPHIEMLKKA